MTQLKKMMAGIGGVGVYCNNFPKRTVSRWCNETPHAVTEEEFVRATTIWTNETLCPQYKGK